MLFSRFIELLKFFFLNCVWYLSPGFFFHMPFPLPDAFCLHALHQLLLFSVSPHPNNATNFSVYIISSFSSLSCVACLSACPWSTQCYFCISYYWSRLSKICPLEPYVSWSHRDFFSQEKLSINTLQVFSTYLASDIRGYASSLK